jgi:hypothetical protein
VVDGKYPEGEALDRLLDAYVSNARKARAQLRTSAANEATILALIKEPGSMTRAAAVQWRNQFLKLTDWTQIPDAPLTAETRKTWAAYRQMLRDLTAQPGFPQTTAWPQPPAPIKNVAGATVTSADGSPLRPARPA